MLHPSRALERWTSKSFKGWSVHSKNYRLRMMSSIQAFKMLEMIWTLRVGMSLRPRCGSVRLSGRKRGRPRMKLKSESTGIASSSILWAPWSYSTSKKMTYRKSKLYWVFIASRMSHSCARSIPSCISCTYLQCTIQITCGLQCITPYFMEGMRSWNTSWKNLCPANLRSLQRDCPHQMMSRFTSSPKVELRPSKCQQITHRVLESSPTSS